MHYEPRFDIFALFMLLGIFQGIFLAYFYLIRKNRKDQTNLLWGILIFTIALMGSEILLNYSGLMVKVIFIENYSESLIFLAPPLLYLIIRTGLGTPLDKNDWIHFVPFAIYSLYMIFYYVQTPEFKYNQYVYCYQPDWDYLETSLKISDDPLELRSSIKQLYLSQFIIYGILMYQALKINKPEMINGNNQLAIKQYKIFKAHWIHFIAIFFLILFVKMTFERDLGDYIIGSYLSLLIYAASFMVLKNANLSATHQSAANNERPKYEKSSLTSDKKKEILEKINTQFNSEKIFLKNNISLGELSKAIHEPSHHISQVLNEELGKTFFDILSDYRIEEAKILLHNPEYDRLTIEDIAEQVGYNSKAAFNKAFKKITNTTPSEFRKQK